MTTVVVKRLSERVGSEIVGVSAEQLVSDDGLATAILDALAAHGVLVFRGLDLQPAAQVAFCRELGRVDESEGHHPVAGIYRVTLDAAKNASAEYLLGTFDWHIDGCTPLHGEPPQLATVLSAKAVADEGGETEFASTYAAYDELSAREQQRLDRLRVVHSMEASQRRRHPHPTDDQLARWRRRPTSEHPLVWTHRDGRKSLVLGTSCDHVVGMDVDESRALLDRLLAWTTRPERVYRHVWSVGDTVIWDNRGVVHRATPYGADSGREMLRTTVLGDEPIR
jgi:alpha-ketoglutarate-dependent taurine dioxygenase